MNREDAQAIIDDLAKSHPAIQATMREVDLSHLPGYTGAMQAYELCLSRGNTYIVLQSSYDWLRARMYRDLFTQEQEVQA